MLADSPDRLGSLTVSTLREKWDRYLKLILTVDSIPSIAQD